ncbi:MAG: repeat protein [Pedosphaera sp.]|nr:repeat protein [Pedosphaera sp.]
MRKRCQVILTLVVIALLPAVAWQVRRPRQPAYQGKTISAWLDQYSHPTPLQSRDTAQAAIQNIGTNAIPVLLKMIRTHDSPLEHSTKKLLRKQSLIPIHWHTDNECRAQACLGFRILSLNARAAAADLADLAIASPDPGIRASAARALNFIVPEVDDGLRIKQLF